MRIGIIGGGAAGMMAALHLKDEYNITILDHTDSPLKKLSITGNGRCNLTNLDMSGNKYYSEDNNRLIILLNSYNPKNLIDDLMRFGIYCYDKGGYVYPMSNQATSVAMLIRKSLEESKNVKLKYNQIIENIEIGDVFKVVLEGGFTYEFDKLILATGGASYKKTGSDGKILSVLERLGIKYKSFMPALSMVKVSDKAFLDELSGVRTRVRLSTSDGLYVSEGEMQITAKGLSGIVVYDLSRLYNSSYNELLCDFLPDIDDKTFEEMINTNSYALYGLMNSKLAKYFYDGDNIKNIKRYPFKVNGLGDIEEAQVCAGGVCLSEINDNFESVRYNNLYMIGEMLDVDGRCGGYNLHWAFLGAALAAEGIKNDSHFPD